MAEATTLLRPRQEYLDDELFRSDGTDASIAKMGAAHQTISLFLERSPTGGVSSNGITFDVPPSERQTRVTVVPRFTGSSEATPEYTATLRRRKLGTLANEFKTLAKLGADETFVLAVDAVIARIEVLLKEFAEAPREGNTREVLRTLRNGLRNGGWDRLRKPEAAERVFEFIKRLAGVEWITTNDATNFHDLADQLALDPLTVPGDQWPG